MEDVTVADQVQFELMRPAQIVEARRRCPVAYLPVGPLEWHGPHLPMGTDGIHAHRIALEVARRVGGVVFPPYFLGTDTVRPPDGPQGVRALGFRGDERIIGMDFPANPVKSVYVEEGAFAVIIREIVKLIKNSKKKVQASIQGDLVRVSGKDRDALQEIIALLRQQDFGIDMQFTNYRTN